MRQCTWYFNPVSYERQRLVSVQRFVNNKLKPEFTQPGKLTIETLEQGVKYVQSVFIVNFEHISHLVLVFLL